MAKRRKEEPRVFSGKSSKQLWKDINATHDATPVVWLAIYALGCKCQELEVIVRRLEKEQAGARKASD